MSPTSRESPPTARGPSFSSSARSRFKTPCASACLASTGASCGRISASVAARCPKCRDLVEAEAELAELDAQAEKDRAETIAVERAKLGPDGERHDMRLSKMLTKLLRHEAIKVRPGWPTHEHAACHFDATILR